MKTILIADGGSTKIDWALINDGKSRRLSPTPGINPAHAADEAMHDAVANVLPQLDGLKPDEIYYYGAGCLPHLAPRMEEALKASFPESHIEVYTDILGAARALLSDREGIIGILGTGSASGYYNGREITKNIPSLGYVLGDEGSGAVLGNRLVGDVFKGVFPPQLCDVFFEETKLTLEEVIDRVYRRPEPNRFLASLVPFLKRHLDRPHVRHLVTIELCRYMARNIGQYRGYEKLPVTLCGSIAANFREQLDFAASSVGVHLARVEASPIEGLIAYHQGHA